MKIPDSKDFLAKIESLTADIEKAKNLRILAAGQGWKELEAAVGQSIVAKVNRLCDKGCDDRETIGLRHEIHALKWFLAVPKISDRDFEQTTKKLQDLRQTVERMHNAGHMSDAERSQLRDSLGDLAKTVAFP